jgi:predicted transcriptional regulator
LGSLGKGLVLLHGSAVAGNPNVLQLCYAPDVGSSTSSFRIPDDLRIRLDETSRRMNKGKNWIINQAVEQYLERHSQAGLREEAKRQSRLASRKCWKDAPGWEKAAGENWNE